MITQTSSAGEICSALAELGPGALIARRTSDPAARAHAAPRHVLARRTSSSAAARSSARRRRCPLPWRRSSRPSRTSSSIAARSVGRDTPSSRGQAPLGRDRLPDLQVVDELEQRVESRAPAWTLLHSGLHHLPPLSPRCPFAERAASYTRLQLVNTNLQPLSAMWLSSRRWVVSSGASALTRRGGYIRRNEAPLTSITVPLAISAPARRGRGRRGDVLRLRDAAQRALAPAAVAARAVELSAAMSVSVKPGGDGGDAIRAGRARGRATGRTRSARPCSRRRRAAGARRGRRRARRR